MQVSLNTRLELSLRQALDKYAEDSKIPLAKIVAEGLVLRLPKEYLPKEVVQK